MELPEHSYDRSYIGRPLYHAQCQSLLARLFSPPLSNSVSGIWEERLAQTAIPAADRLALC